MSGKKSEIEKILEQNPGDPLFVEHAETLRVSGHTTEALLVALRGISANPALHKGRLVLARIFYELACYPFAANEIAYLVRAIPNSSALRKLMERLAPYADSAALRTGAPGAVIAEAEFEVDEIEGLEREKSKD